MAKICDFSDIFAPTGHTISLNFFSIINLYSSYDMLRELGIIIDNHFTVIHCI